MFGKLLTVRQAGSTQDLAKDMAINGEPEGTAVMALNQTQGRGRAGHGWVSPPGRNLAISVILRPPLDAGDAPLLGLLASIAVARTVESCGVLGVALKWPNDVLAESRKIAGILPEAVMEGGRIRFVIMGIGLNVNSQQSDFALDFPIPATSLLLCTGREWDLNEVAVSLLEQMGDLYNRSLLEGTGFVPGMWETWWAHRGRVLTWGDIRGTAEGVDPDGALRLRSSDGTLNRVIGGEVSVPES